MLSVLTARFNAFPNKPLTDDFEVKSSRRLILTGFLCLDRPKANDDRVKSIIVVAKINNTADKAMVTVD